MRYFGRKVALLIIAVAALAGPAQAQRVPPRERCAAITPTQVAGLFDRWNAALATGNPDAVTATYTPDAVLLPTVERGPLIGTAAIRGYFVGFLKKHPHGTIDTRVIRIGCNMAYDVGLYTFMLDGTAPGSRVALHARYTYIYVPDHGHWLIVHHHSSAVPAEGR